MKKKKEFKLKINKLYLYWYYMHFLRKYGILLFTQNLAVDAKSDLDMQLNFLDKGRECKVLIFDSWMAKMFLGCKKNLSFKNWNRIKDFTYIIGLKNIEDIADVEKTLKERKVLIKGYYIHKIFFSKYDWNSKLLEKKNLISNFKQRLNIFYILLVKIILLLKKRI